MKRNSSSNNKLLNISSHQFDFAKEYVFENEVVKISPLVILHIEKLKSISQDEEIWTYFLEKGMGDEYFSNYCMTAIHNRAHGKEYPFVIFDKRVNSYAGMTRLYDFHPELGVIKMGHTWIGKDFWGTNLNKHCKFLLCEFIFEELDLERIGFGVHGQNLRSIQALSSIGCDQEGVLRNFLPSIYDTQRVDLFLFSLLKWDWNSKIKAMLEMKLK